MKLSALLLICTLLASAFVSVGCTKSSNSATAAPSGPVAGVAMPSKVAVVTAK